jgi:hypothetical protein
MKMKMLSLLLLALFILPVTARADEFTEGVINDVSAGISQPRGSRVVCSDDVPGECAYLRFNTVYNTVTLTFSPNNFTNSWTTITRTVPGSDITNDIDFLGEYYPLPLDITWIDGVFYLFVKNNVYNFTRTQDSVITIRTEDLGVSYLNFLTDTTAARLKIKRDTPSAQIEIDEVDILTGNVVVDIIDNPSFVTCYDPAGGGAEKVQGWVAKAGSTYIYEVKFYFYRCPGTYTTYTMSNGLGNIPSDYDGVYYYRESRFLYHRAENLTGNVSKGVYESTTSDLSSFSAPVLIYAENSSIDEKIRTADYKNGLAYGFYAFERYSNRTTLVFGENQYYGIYVYYQHEQRIPVVSNVYNIDDLSQETTQITAVLRCATPNVTRTYTDVSPELSSPCTNPEIEIYSPYKPTYYTFNLNIPSNCRGDSAYYLNLFYWQPYTTKVYAIDEIFGTYIENISITLDTDTNTTNAEGYTEFDIYPLTNTTFTILENNPTSCYETYIASGNSKIFQAYSTGSGYLDDFDILTFVDDNPINILDFDKSGIITMIPDSTSVEVHLFTKDLIEISPISAIVRENGSNITYWYSNGDFYQTNTVQDSLPVTFVLIDNRSSWSAIFSVEYGGITYTKNLTIEQNQNYRVDLIIDDISTEMFCSSNDDCRISHCKGTFYKEFVGCISSQCTYSSEQCLANYLCDETIGCFDVKSTDSCEVDEDCDTVCLNNYTMSAGSCLSDNYCGIKRRTCSEGCNSTLGLCNEFAQCVTGTSENFNVVLYEDYNVVMGSQSTITCSLDNSGTSFCLPAVTINKADLIFYGATIRDMSVSPENRLYIERTDHYYFYPISVTCSESCGLTYQSCLQSCSPDTGACTGIGVPFNEYAQNVSDYIDVGVDMLNQIFPNIQSKTMISAIIILILMGGLVYGLNKVNGSSNWEVGVAGSIIMTGALAFVGWFDPLITIFFIIIAGFILVKSTFWSGG